jgi:hypothetical protein
MNCEDYIVWINGHIDGTNTEFEEGHLNDHLASCPHCRQIPTQMEENDKALRSSRLTPPESIIPNVMMQIRKEKQKRKNRFLRYSLSGVATAAVLFLCVLGFHMLPNRTAEEPTLSDIALVADQQEPAKRSISESTHKIEEELMAEAPLATPDEENTAYSTVFLFVDPQEPLPVYDGLFADTAELLMNEEAYAFYLQQEQAPLLMSMLSEEQLSELSYVESTVFPAEENKESYLVVLYPAA